MKPLKICFVSLNSYPLFKTNHPGYFGGAELQMSLIAKELARDKRFEVSVVVGDYGQKPVAKSDNLTLYLAFRKHWLFFWEIIRFFWLLGKINAEVYVERVMNIKVGLVAAWCKVFKKMFVYMAAHDWDTQLNHDRYLNGTAKVSFNFGLKHADLIISQTQNQKRRLKNNFGSDSVVIRSLAIGPLIIKASPRRFFLWVGRADEWKRPKIFIDLAKKLPKKQFVMICRRGNNQKYFSKIKSLALAQPNLEFLEAVSHDAILNYFQQAKALVNTSVAEGFPNTFLQAGMVKTPIISLKVNPDNFITKYNCGVWANNNFSRLIRACQNIKTDMGNNNFLYVKRFHSLANAKKLGQILLDHFSWPAN